VNSNCFNCKNMKMACGEYYCSYGIEELCSNCGRPMYNDEPFECEKFEKN
jgi:hypothetical protein